MYAAQGKAEGRTDDQPGHQEHRQHDDKGVDEGRLAPQVEFEQAQHRINDDALQAVGTAGDAGQAVGKLAEQHADPNGDHQSGQIGAAHDQVAQCIAQRGADQQGKQQAGEGFAPAMLSQQPCGISPATEECRMADGQDAGIAQRQIE
ncbi:hypothetical protein SDC9_140902 [bioreactor metagenome]|uniref:Uncharacterized protein n=1 Tax=bioreactor metagenome TaxID=1076179 RepID=A0A645DW75_9ZZZZ